MRLLLFLLFCLHFLMKFLNYFHFFQIVSFPHWDDYPHNHCSHQSFGSLVFNWWNYIIKSSYLAKNYISQIPFLLSLERQLRSLFSTHLFFSNIFSLSFQTYVLPLHLKTNYTHFNKRKTSLKKSYSFSISISSMFFLTICCPLPLCCKNTAIRKRK